MSLTMASLFDGSGGFPLAAKNEGITPVWASEIEPFPIRVTTKRLPEVKHYGNVAEIDGSAVEPVDIITFGSPCQDMSVAGKRAGLKGERSNLFYEAIRIIREMRVRTNGRYPRYIVWENVPGAFSSNKGEDFRCVLESICKIKDDWSAVPRPRKWNNAGCIVGDDFSVGWRVLDAQYWGVPQRRKRIFLVADLADRGGVREILFDRQSLQGNSEQSESEKQETSRIIGNGTETSVAGIMFENHGQDSRYRKLDKAMSVTAQYGTGGNNQPFVVQPTAFRICAKDSNAMKSDNPQSGFYETDKSSTVDTSNQSPCKNQGGIVVIEGNGARPSHKGDGYRESETMYTLNTTEQHAVAFSNQHATLSADNGPKGLNSQMLNDPEHNFVCCYAAGKESHFKHAYKEQSPTLTATDYKELPLINQGYTVRRLTPTECARLQGFPDWWCSDLGIEEPTAEEIQFWENVFETHRKIMGTSKKSKTEKQIVKWLKNPHTDSAEYKMWGNGVALPCVQFIMHQIAQRDKETECLDLGKYRK